MFLRSFSTEIKYTNVQLKRKILMYNDPSVNVCNAVHFECVAFFLITLFELSLGLY